MNTALMFSSKSNEWATPQDFFNKLNEEFGFTLDVAATSENAKCRQFFTESDDGLKQDWSAHKFVWMNPPYGRGIGDWVRKAAAESKKGCTVVCLIPARTDTQYWHKYVWDYEKNAPREGVDMPRFIPGRLRFGGHKNAAPFPSVVIIFKGQ